jgi:hypothetical protein
MPRCRRCGKTVKEGVDHCQTCGAPVKDWEPIKDRESYRTIGILFLLLGFAACLGAIGAFILLSKIPVVPTIAVYAISAILLVVGLFFLYQGRRISIEGDS